MRAERIRTSIPVEFEGGDVRGSGVIRNVGLGGLFVGSRSIPDQGEAVSLRFQLPGQGSVSVMGLVWWTTQEGSGRHCAVPGFGLRLIEENETYQDAVSRMLD